MTSLVSTSSSFKEVAAAASPAANKEKMASLFMMVRVLFESGRESVNKKISVGEWMGGGADFGDRF